MASAIGTHARCRHRHRRHHLARHRQGRQLGEADRRQVRHPRDPPLSDRRTEDHDRRNGRLHSGRAVLLDRARRAHGRHRGRGSDRRIRHRHARATFPARCSSRWRRSRSSGRIAKRSRRHRAANDTVNYDDLLRAVAGGRFRDVHERCLMLSVADHLADRFGTKGSPISLSTACASGASAIQLGVEAIRRGETDAALCVATDGSVNPEALIRFSLLSALSTANDPPQGAAKPFSKNRDGFVMAEGAGALVLESLEHAKARGAKILGVIEGCGEMADSFHRTRSSPDGKPIIGCIRNAIADAGLTPGRHRLHQPARHRHAGERQDGALGVAAVFGERAETHPDLVQQVDDRPYAVGRRRGRGGVHAADARAPAHPADHQLRGARPGDPARRGAERGARRQGARMPSRTRSDSAARTSRWSWARSRPDRPA